MTQHDTGMNVLSSLFFLVLPPPSPSTLLTLYLTLPIHRESRANCRAKAGESHPEHDGK